MARHVTNDNTILRKERVFYAKVSLPRTQNSVVTHEAVTRRFVLGVN
jgi:hypothetical protein